MADPDLFGVPPAQGSLFGEGEDRMQAPQRSTRPDPDKIRSQLRAVIAKARRAETLPWPERETRMWQTVFPNMASWLPEEEAEQLVFEFTAEIERLKPAA